MSALPPGGPPSVVAVVMPCRNARRVIDAQLEALARQDFAGPWELVVADNGSTDGTADHVRGWQERLPNLRLVDGSEIPGAGPARNAGVATVTAPLIAFCDADDVVADSWLSELVRASVVADLVGGRYVEFEGDSLPPPDAIGALPGIHCRFRPAVHSCNMIVSRTAFESVGGFDPHFRYGQDMELSWRLLQQGFSSGLAPEAVVYKRARTGWRRWRQQFRWSRYEVALFRLYRHEGMPRSSVGEAIATWGYLGVAIPLLAFDDTRARWLRRAAVRAGRLVGSISEATLYL